MFSGIGYLRDNVPDGLEELLVYFDSTYISGTCRSIRCTTTGQQSSLRLRLRRQTPQLPITWNVFDATVSHQQRTNNDTEAWNYAFAGQVGHSHPSLYRLIDNLRKDNALVVVAL